MCGKYRLLIVLVFTVLVAVIAVAFTSILMSEAVSISNLLNYLSYHSAAGSSQSETCGVSKLEGRSNYFFIKDIISEDHLTTYAELTLKPHLRSSTTNRLKDENKSTAAEVQASLNLAREMIEQGKGEKALKILQHALALSPHHPDVLNEYGEFLEHTAKDIVLAEHMYCRALVSSPSHTRAISNRLRTLPLVEEIDHSRFDRIDRKRDMLMRVPEGHPGLRRMVRESYFRHLYHTTAMEGNTFTLSQTRSFVETRIVIAGKSIMEHNEILGMEAAFNFLNSSLAKRLGLLTVKDITDIHRHVLGYVDPIGAGLLRTTQVFVADFVPPPPSELESLMLDFINWINNEETFRLHPIEMAALTHYKLVYIHPFYDGNGRTSRLLMNLVLMQLGYPPIIIPVEKKYMYYKHLQEANDGDVRPFVRFIAECAEQTIEEFLWSSVENINRTFPELTLMNYESDRHDESSWHKQQQASEHQTL